MVEFAWSSSAPLSSSERSRVVRSSSNPWYASSTAPTMGRRASGILSSRPKQRRSCRRKRLCTGSHLAEGGDRHGLVVQLAARAPDQRRDLAVGIETRHCRVRPQHVPHRLHLLLDALLE